MYDVLFLGFSIETEIRAYDDVYEKKITNSEFFFIPDPEITLYF